MKKEKAILRLFFNEPSRHWHFEEILKEAKISRPQAALWLRKFIRECLVRRVKLKGRMPYCIAQYEHPNYQNKKRLFALQEVEEAGLLLHLASLTKANNVILFGSLSRWDWYKESDIDVFIYGDPEGIDMGIFRRKLHRDIQTFICKDKEELVKLNPELLKSILEGYSVKGALNFVEVIKHA